MPSRTTIWFRDAFVIIFALYVVVSIAMVPWSNLKISEPASTTCPTGCSPSINFPENNYHHYDDSLIFNWNAVAVTYRTEIVDSEGQIVLSGKNHDLEKMSIVLKKNKNLIKDL